MSAEASPAHPEPMTGATLAITAVALALGTMMQVLDGSIANVSIPTIVAPIAGPLLGGYISDNMSWPWIFLINLPVGAACAFLCWRNMRHRETATRKAPVDVVGFMLLLTWVGAFQIMLDTGKDADWYSSPVIIALAIVSAIAFIAWMIWELTERPPIVDLSLF